MKKIAILFAFVFCLTLPAYSQVYSLDFSGELGKGVSGTVGGWGLANITMIDWTIGYTGFPGAATPQLPDSYWKVIDQSGNEVFAGRGFSGQAKWLGNNIPPGGIDISGMGNVRATVDLGEIGDLEPGDRVQVLYRLDGFAETHFDINGDLSDDFGTITASQSGINGSTLRIFAFVDGDGDDDIIYIDNVLVETVCIPPATAASGLVFTKTGSTELGLGFTPGNGGNRVVVMREGAPVNTFPVDGETYTADADFSGSPDPTIPGGDEYVVYNGSGDNVLVTGLTPGTEYYVAVFEYDDATPCYLTLTPALGNTTTLCGTLTDVGNAAAAGDFQKATLSWDLPACYDDFLVVAGTAPITGTPTGDGSSYAGADDSDFSTAADATGFPAGEKNVYYGNGTGLMVTGLENVTTYYFKIFTRIGNVWSAGVEVSATAGCPELGGDVVFINEINYVSGGSPNTNQGFELAGPADTDLSNYTVYFYNKQGKVFNTVALSGTIPDQQGGYGVFYINADPMIQGNESAIALYNETTMEVVEFISYKKASQNDNTPADVITGDEGVADGLDSTPLPVNKRANDGDDMSIQRGGTGPCPGDMTWAGPKESTPGEPNEDQVLPIELAFFKATLKQGKVILEWQTLTENKNDYMAVERSADAISFREIGRVAGAGDSYEARNYSHIDYEPLAGINYYRLRQVDFDGQANYSKIVSVLTGTAGGDLVAFPTVTSKSLQVHFGTALRGEGELRIFDLTGRLLYREPVGAGTEATTLEIPDWAPGTYLLQLQDGRDLRATRFVKVE